MNYIVKYVFFNGAHDESKEKLQNIARIGKTVETLAFLLRCSRVLTRPDKVKISLWYLQSQYLEDAILLSSSLKESQTMHNNYSLVKKKTAREKLLWNMNEAHRHSFWAALALQQNRIL